MRVLITGICGFVGSTLAQTIRQRGHTWTIVGVDNLIRRGSQTNLELLRKLEVQFTHADLRSPSDLDSIPACDWIIDAAANASVLAGTNGNASSRQLMEHNLFGTVNLLERCRQNKAGFILLSTSRVYSINPLNQLKVSVRDRAYCFDHEGWNPNLQGLSKRGIAESFTTAPPISLYGASKLASECLATEYGLTYDFPVWINRCGVMAGGGQFGRPDQGIFAYWIHSHCWRQSLQYLGFDGQGHQVRDCLHPRDLIELIEKQICAGFDKDRPAIVNVSGGINSATSLRQLTDWCDNKFGKHTVNSLPKNRPFDLPWVVLDSSLAQRTWDWQATTSVTEIFEEIAEHARQHPEWLALSR